MPEIRTSRCSVRAGPDELDRWQVVTRRAGLRTTAGWIRALLRDAEFSGQKGDRLLADHMLRGDKNEVLLVCEGSEYWLKDWVKEAKREGLTYGLLHISFNPEQTLNCQGLSTGSVRNLEQIKRLVPLSFTKKTVKGMEPYPA